MRDIGHALQSLRHGRCDALEVTGDLDDQQAARMLVADFITVFELDVSVSELPDGFRVELRHPPDRTIRVTV